MALKRCGVYGVAFAFPLVLAACSSSSSGTDGTSNDAGVGSSSDAAISANDAQSPPASDSSSSADASSACTPGNVQGYVAKWTPPKSPQSACTMDQLTSYGACLDSGDPNSAACSPWFGADAAASATCKACVTDSKSTDPAWGPLVDVGSTGSDRQLNVSGCLAIILHDTGSGCAGSFQALQECESAACADNCQGASSAALTTCIDEADSVGCSNYLTPAACVLDAGANADTCFGPSQGSFGAKFAAVAAVFCLETDGGP